MALASVLLSEKCIYYILGQLSRITIVAHTRFVGKPRWLLGVQKSFLCRTIQTILLVRLGFPQIRGWFFFLLAGERAGPCRLVSRDALVFLGGQRIGPGSETLCLIAKIQLYLMTH